MIFWGHIRSLDYSSHELQGFRDYLEGIREFGNILYLLQKSVVTPLKSFIRSLLNPSVNPGSHREGFMGIGFRVYGRV